MGTLRFKPELKKIIENRFPHSKILNEELIMDWDHPIGPASDTERGHRLGGKMRYPDSLRTDIYLKMTEFLNHCGFKKEKIYLCMENSDIWHKTNLKLNRKWTDR